MEMKFVPQIAFLALSLSGFNLIASDNKPWRIIRKEDQAARALGEEAKRDLTVLFCHMHSRSKIKQICLRQAVEAGYNCQWIAAALYCAQRVKAPGQVMFCQHFHHDADWVIRDLGDDHKLSYSQIEWERRKFKKTLVGLSR